LDLAIGRLGELAFDFLLVRDNKPAVEVIEHALRQRPDRRRLHMIHAHMLMLTARIIEAKGVHSKYFLDRLDDGEIWGNAIRQDFARLRRVGINLPIMNSIRHDFDRKI
jgi:hypothetical protein